MTTLQLTTVFIIIAALAAAATLAQRAHAQAKGPVQTGDAAKRINVEEFDKMRADTNYVVLDVRTSKEFSAGHVPRAVNISVNSSDFEAKAAALSKEKPCLVYCAAGVRSAKAVQELHRIGFKQLFDFRGGWLAWREAGKPVEK
ncbi:MAG: rhodanese-like domain-containing protein [Verrucomicrobia bacterium]|nr:rhodanese-like domain-containing protein [Verrucomicrobiota bacterium]